MDKDILRLDVPMDDAVLMGMLQRGQDPDGDLRRHGGVDAPLLPDDLLEGLALDVLHHQVAVVPVHAHVQKVDDIVVGHAAGGLRLPLEAADELRVLVELGLEHLHRHAVPRALIDGAVNNGHAAHADLLHQAVAVSQYFFAHRLPSLSWRSTTVTLSCPPAARAASTSSFAAAFGVFTVRIASMVLSGTMPYSPSEHTSHRSPA